MLKNTFSCLAAVLLIGFVSARENSVCLIETSSITIEAFGKDAALTGTFTGLSDTSYFNSTDAFVRCPGVTKTWDGFAWTSSGAPDINDIVVINGDYDTGTNGNIDACMLTIYTGRTLTVNGGSYINVNTDINVKGTASLIVEHQGNVVQINSSASVYKGSEATINVELTTPILQTRDFMVMGSPMDSETRTGVYNSAFLVLEHTPANFTPHPEVPAGGTSFMDDNGDFWSQVASGNMNVGEGFIVRPQDSYVDPANEAYNFTYSLGTLNTGNYNRTIQFNGLGPNPDGTPNVLSNPYPSALSAFDFIQKNRLINEVYFWEHLTPPSDTIPGSNNINFSMGDVSMYNLGGGVKAFNDPGTSTEPNGIISTGQGFGIQAKGAGTVTFKNPMRRTSGNITLRTPMKLEQEINRLWLDLSSTSYEVSSTSLIAFCPEATPELDPGYDSKRLANFVSLYSQLEDGSEQLGIQSRESFESGIKVLIGFASEIEELTYYTLSIDHMEGLQIANATVYLYDNQENVHTNLNNTDYSFVSNKGNFPGRFTLQFEADVTLETPDLAMSHILVYPNPTKDVINIVSPGTPITKISIYDIGGRKVKQLLFDHENNCKVDISQLEAAIYFFNIQNNGGMVTKRVIKQ